MSDEKTPFHNPFAQLKQLRGDRPAESAPAPPTPPAPEPVRRSAGPSIPRAVVRLERSGRGGKEVTVIEQLVLDDAGRQMWLKALKSSLGCGGTIEGETLVLQGDHRERLRAVLTARGVKKVTIS